MWKLILFFITEKKIKIEEEEKTELKENVETLKNSIRKLKKKFLVMLQKKV